MFLATTALLLTPAQSIHCTQEEFLISASTPVELGNTYQTDPSVRLSLSGDLAVLPGGGSFVDGFSLVTFERDPSTGLWSERHVLSPPPGGNVFAAAHDLQGNSLLVTERGWEDSNGTRRGRVRAYEWNTVLGEWVHKQIITPSIPGDVLFGQSIARDGDWAAIQLLDANSLESFTHMYQRDAGSGLWSFHSELATPGFSAIGDMDLHEDVLVTQEFTYASNDHYVYRRNQANDWVFEATLSNFEPNHEVERVQLVRDQLITSIVTEIYNKAYILTYRRDPVSGSWYQAQQLNSEQFLPGDEDRDFVTFSANDDLLLVSQGEWPYLYKAGRIVRYIPDENGDWTPDGVIDRGPQASIYDRFGSQLAVDDTRFLVSSSPSAATAEAWVFNLDTADRNGDGMDDVCQAVGDSYCGPSNPNSVGLSARIFGLGSGVLGDLSLDVCADQLPPNVFGYLLASSATDFLPNVGGSSGNLCLGGGTSFGRYTNQVGSSGAAGQSCVTIELPNVPTAIGPHALAPGDTWHFQYWYRDGQTSNFTEGLAITFE